MCDHLYLTYATTCMQVESTAVHACWFPHTQHVQYRTCSHGNTLRDGCLEFMSTHMCTDWAGNQLNVWAKEQVRILACKGMCRDSMVIDPEPTCKQKMRPQPTH